MVVDVFPFFNELDVLEIRVNELKGVVDYHLLVEANRTYTGKPKPLIYQSQPIQRQFGKIIPIGLNMDQFDADSHSPWERESFQCESAYRLAIGQMGQGDVMIVGDLDEIPKAHVVQGLFSEGRPFTEPVALEMTSYSCYLDWATTVRKANSPVVLPYTDALRLGKWSTIRKSPIWTTGGISLPFAGWHFTDMGGDRRNVEKLTAFSHAPEPGPTESVANILSGRETLFERYKREGAIRQTGLDGHPRYVRENVDRMIELGLLQPRDQ